MASAAFQWLTILCMVLFVGCAGSRFSIGSLPQATECIAVVPFEIRYDLSSPKEMLSEFVALDLYKRGAHGVLGPLELMELYKEAQEPLPPAIDPYWAREIGKKLNVDAVLFGSITQIPVFRGEEQRAHVNIDAYLLDVESGAIRWSYGSKEEVSTEAYVGFVSDRAEEMSRILLSDAGDRYRVGTRGCWTPLVSAKALSPAPKGSAVDSVIIDSLTSHEEEMLATLLQGDPLVLDAAIFEDRSTRLTKEAIPHLRSLGNVLKHAKAPDRILVESHLDASQDIGKDLALSKRRAEVIGQYLNKLGVQEVRISAVGFGGSRPIVPNLNERSRVMNRRVEILSGSAKRP